jgi:hypothetical protein
MAEQTISRRIQLSDKGTPFQSEDAARKYLIRQGMNPDGYTVEKYQGGWAIMGVVGAGAPDEPPVSRGPYEEKMAGLTPVGLRTLPDQPVTVAVDDGESYHWVRFMLAASDNDPKDVELTVNGDPLIIQRGVEVPLPRRYLEAADHATHETIVHGEVGTLTNRSKPRRVQLFPYERLDQRACTREDFLRFLRRQADSLPGAVL